MQRLFHLKSLCILILISLSILNYGCGLTEDSSSFAIVEGYVYTDATFTTGAPGVEVIIESDLQSDIPYTGPDVITFTDSTGYFVAEVYLQHTRSDSVAIYTYTADVSVYFYHRGNSFRINGVTLHTGKRYQLPPVHLGMFQ